eukprot:1752767-Amphidinium_carterae.2
MMQRPASTKKPLSMYTRSRGVNWKYHRRRDIHREVEVNFVKTLCTARTRMSRSNSSKISSSRT